MSEAALAPAPPPPAEPTPPPPTPGFLESIFGVLIDPAEAFREILRAPRVLPPLLLWLALMSIFTGYWAQKVDPQAFVRHQIESSGREIPADRLEQIVETQARVFKYTVWLGPVFGPVIIVVLAGILLFVFRFFYGSEVVFKQAMTVVTWSFAALSVVTTPLLLVIFTLKGDWNLPPDQVLQANPTLFLEKDAVAKPLWAFLSTLDILSFWTMYMLAAGFGAAAARTTGWALPGIVVPWAVYVLGKTALAFVF